MTISKVTLTKVRSEVDAALAQIAAKHGLDMKLGNGTFNPDTGEFSFKLLGFEGSKTDAENKRLAKCWELYGPSLGLKVEWLGKTIPNGPNTLTIVGYDDKKRGEKCIALSAPDGQRFYSSVWHITAAMAQQERRA